VGKSNNGEKGQLTWTRLPQGFKTLPTIFGTALASSFKAFSTDQHGCTPLWYVDDLPLAGPTWEEPTSSFLFYGRQDTKSLGKRPRFAKTLSNTLAFTCPGGNATLRRDRLPVQSQLLRPTGKSEFLEAAGFCRIWISNY
jgi:hypothetical protein